MDVSLTRTMKKARMRMHKTVPRAIKAISQASSELPVLDDPVMRRKVKLNVAVLSNN